MLFSLALLVSSISLNAQCNYSIVLYDSFGDGWDNGEVEIFVDGVSAGVYTLATGGGPETYNFTVNTGDIITSTYTPSNWPYENEYRIYDSDNNLIFTDGTAGSVAPSANNTVVGTGNCPLCSQPVTLTVSGITQTSASLGWTSSTGLWNIEWGLSGFTQGTGTLITGTTTNPYPISGLTANTSYDFYVQSDCGINGLSNWAGPYTFSTSCSPANLCTYTLYMTDQGNSWNGAYIEVIQNGVSLGTYTVPGGGSNTETVGLCNGSTVQLLWSSGSYDNETSFDMQSPYSTSVYSWTAGNAPVPGVFHTFVVSCTPPTCPDPSGLTATNITSNSADLGWTENGPATSWNIEWGNAGFTQGTGTMVSGTSLNPYAINGLLANSAYEFYVQSFCGLGDLSNWIGPFPFVTSCAPFVAPYFQNFDSGTMAICWQNVLTDDFDWTLGMTTPTANTGPENGDHTTGTGYFAYTEASNPNNPNKRADYLTPFIDISTLTNPSLTFWYNLYGANMGVLHVDVFDGIWHDDQFVISGDQGDVWTYASVDLSTYSNPVQVRFRGVTGTNYLSDMAIDDVRFDELTTCPQPSALNAQNIADISADLVWNESGTATVWNIEWGLAGFIQGTGTLINSVTSNPYTLNGLNTLTSYSFYVQADCGGGELSYWSGPYTFTTLMSPLSNPTPCEVNIPITDGGCTEIPIEVTGIAGTQLGTDCFLANVNIIIDHTWDGDVTISLISPGGIEIDISSQNGNANDDYGLIDGTCTVYTNFNMTGVDGTITAGIPPYIGSYIPEGDFADFNNNTNPNGFWILKICDMMMSDVGTFEYAALDFDLILPPAEFIINELDCDLAVNDTMEFVEIYDGGIGNYPLEGHVLVLYNGSSDQSYAAYDLDGYSTDSNGYFLVGNADVPGVGITFADNFLQNGTDAAALYLADGTDFPVGTAITQTDIVDALVYHTNDAFDPQLLTLINTGQPQINEDNLGNKDAHSCSRLPNGSGGQLNSYTYNAAIPTPGGPNQAVPVLNWSIFTFTESLSNNGSIGNPIELELDGHNFSQTGVLTQTVHYNASNIPAGLGIEINVLTDSTAEIHLIGNAFAHLDINDISNLTITFLDAAYESIPAAWVINNSKNNIIVDFFDTAPPTLVWSTGDFIESILNDGSIGNEISLTLYSDSFSIAPGIFIQSVHYVVNNLPAGLTAEIEIMNDTSAVIRMNGNATNHENINDVSNLEITFLDAAFTGGIATDIADYTRSDLVIDFLDQYFTDLDISMEPDTAYICNLSTANGLQIYIANEGNTIIPANDTIYFFHQILPSGPVNEDTLILVTGLIPGDSLQFIPQNVVSSYGLNDFQIYLSYYADQEPSNDSALNLVYSYELYVNLGGVNDTITVTSYPYTLNAGFCISPLPCSYLWSSSQTSQTIQVNSDGFYSVSVTDGNGCLVYDSVYVVLSSGEEVSDLIAGINIYPNPNQGIFTLNIQQEKIGMINIDLIDLQGRIVSTKKLSGDDITELLDFSIVSKGLYYLKIDNNSEIVYFKVIIQ